MFHSLRYMLCKTAPLGLGACFHVVAGEGGDLIYNGGMAKGFSAVIISRVCFNIL